MGDPERSAGLASAPTAQLSVRGRGCRCGRAAGGLFLLLLVLLLLCTVRGQEPLECPRPCACPAEPPACAPGVPAVLDGCSCCLVCARQRGEACSERLPCQESRGLYCDRSAGAQAALGRCMDLDGDNCVFDGIIYRSGETFQPNCKYHCTCRDGQIGCVPRCNLDLLLPGPECPFPRKIEVPLECCERWACDSKEDVDLGGVVMAAYRPEATLGSDGSDPGSNCIEQTTEWSACSTTCGMGVSTRITNKNPMCEMVKQTRLCEVRPCDHGLLLEKKGKKCVRSKKSLTAVRLEYKNCTSVQMYKPRYCGICNDGRCCTPHSTRTVPVEFHCPQGSVIKQPVMWVTTCVCHSNCPREDNAFFRKLH